MHSNEQEHPTSDANMPLQIVSIAVIFPFDMKYLYQLLVPVN